MRRLGEALGAHRGQQHLLGGTDARERQRDLGALQALRGVDAQTLGALLDLGAELAQHVHVVVDRSLTDAAATEVGDERLAETVQQRPAEQDRDAARAGVRVDVGHVGPLDVGRVEHQARRRPAHR
ncbi:hypothetical protein GCM10025868_40170 [Angustibacter aerolatus]|uniref:Uncharacterized protein n=1 Tax=Angustibacter aerolatus TaxID=1162965 RepID=A0ABQ6JKJ2_9ACTN|nr:hypothetical protein GCM10025868_40170 [Angustibacter aerolatus]